MSAHHSTDLLLGHRGWWPMAPPCRVASPARSGHMYVVGKTGKGKSKFLLSCIVQDIMAGRGCGVIDPHSDLITEVLSVLDAQGALADPAVQQRLIYLDPTRTDYVIPFNVLGLPAAPYEMAQNVIEAFRRTWAESLAAAPNFENNMLYALLVLIKARRTLVELPRLWLDDSFREQLLAQVNDPELTTFFTQRFARWGRDAALRIESLLNKATALTMNPYLRLMLGQQANHLDFQYVMDKGYVLLANLGHCDEESQKLIGNLITTGFEQAAFARHDIRPSARRPFYLYIDEFQDFSAGTGSGKTFSRILSGARKMGLHLIIAHQNLSQLSERLKGAVIGNVWTKVIFGISEDDAYEFARLVGLGEVNPHTIKHDPQTDTQHPVYLSLPEQYYDLATTLANQPPRRAVVRDHTGRTRPIWTLKVPPTSGYPEALCQARLATIGIPYNQAQQAVARVLAPLPLLDDFGE